MKSNLIAARIMPFPHTVAQSAVRPGGTLFAGISKRRNFLFMGWSDQSGLECWGVRGLEATLQVESKLPVIM